MPRFRYSAINDRGDTITGELEAVSTADAILSLQREGHFPLKTTPVGEGGAGFLKNLLPARRPGRQAVAIATHELASLLPAGLPLDRSLELVIQLTDDKVLKGVLRSITDKVKGGSSLGDALETAPEVFSKLYVSLVRSGEASGSLEPTLVQLGDYLTRAQATRDQIKSALIYPVLLLTASVLALGFILTVVLPQFKPFFAASGAALPAPTAFVMALGDFVGAWWWLILLSIGGTIAGVQYALRQPPVRLWWDRRSLTLPVIGPLIAKSETARFSRTLGTLAKGGLPLPTALSLATETVTNKAMIEALRNATVSLREGGNLAALLTRTKVFPPLATQLMRVGEETGRMDEMLLHQADLFEREVGRTIERMFTAFTPAITIFLGVTVAGIIGSVMLAILKINDVAG
jgi:general secretion pathway protein F